MSSKVEAEVREMGVEDIWREGGGASRDILNLYSRGYGSIVCAIDMWKMWICEPLRVLVVVANFLRSGHVEL